MGSPGSASARQVTPSVEVTRLFAPNMSVSRPLTTGPKPGPSTALVQVMPSGDVQMASVGDAIMKIWPSAPRPPSCW